MTSNELAKTYRSFFLESEAGEHFITELTRMIDDNHQKAEKTPENARDFTQRACGVRETLNLITAVTTEAKKGKPSE